MDRNGKKAKAVRAELHSERSDMKAQERDVLGRTAAAARMQSERAVAVQPGAKAGRKGHRP
jgi:hypothetical protein